MPVPYRLPLPLFLSARFLGIIELCSCSWCSSKILGKWIGFVMEPLTELWFIFLPMGIGSVSYAKIQWIE
jgi:hypothetical protein